VAEAVTTALQPGLRTRAYIFNMILQDKAVDDRLRRTPPGCRAGTCPTRPPTSRPGARAGGARQLRHPAALVRAEGRLLGVDKLRDYDRMAAVTQDEEVIDWPEATDIVLSSFDAFSPELADTARTSSRAATSTRPCARQARRRVLRVRHPSAHPYVLLNWTSKRRDVLTLAHELGHGLHASLARPRGVFEQHTPLTLAETASVFGETLVFRRLLDEAATPRAGSRCWPRTSRTRSPRSSARPP
jgi:oligoendopeptidase F